MGLLVGSMDRCLSWHQIEGLATGELSGTQETEDHIRSCPVCCKRLEGFVRLLAVARMLFTETAADAVDLDALRLAVAGASPVRPISCRQARRLMGDYLDQTVPHRLVPRLEAHLFTCEACYHRYRELLDVRAAAAAVMTETPPTGLRERIHASVAASRSPRPVRVHALPRPVWVGAAAVLVLALSLTAIMIWSPRQGAGTPAIGPVDGAVAERVPLPPEALALAEPTLRPQTTPRRERLASARVEGERRKAAPHQILPSRDRDIAHPPTPPSPKTVTEAPVMVATRSHPPAGRVSRPMAPEVAAVVPTGVGEAMARPEETPAAPGQVLAPTPDRPAPSTVESTPGPEPRPVTPSPGTAVATTTPSSSHDSVRLAVAGGTNAESRWLPVRSAETSHVVVAKSGEEQLEAAARRLNASIQEDERASGRGWISIK